MNRPNLIGSKIYGDVLTFGGPTDFTNVQIGAIDSPVSADAICPNAYTATLANQIDTRKITGLNTDIVLAIGQKVAFGVFMLPFAGKESTHFYCEGTMKFFGSDDTANSLRIFPVFGRISAAAPTVSIAAAVNSTANYRKLPDWGFSTANAASSQKESIMNSEIIVPYNSTIANFCVFCGFVIENPAAVALKIIGLQGTIAMQKYNADIPCFDTLAK